MSDFPLCRITLFIFYSFYFSYTLLFHIPPRISCSNLWLAAPCFSVHSCRAPLILWKSSTSTLGIPTAAR